jgi:hypothetical protein
MTYKLKLASAAAADEARIGGGALIGGVADWPVSPFGSALVLVASLPREFVAAKAGIDLGAGRIASVFTTYAKGEYFLDQITYHGDPSELALLRRGTTQVLVHDRGELVHGAVDVPARRIDAGDAAGERSEDWNEDDIPNPDSLVGGDAQLLQQEELDVEGLAFALQLYGGDLAEPFRDLFYLADGVGYLYLPKNPTAGVDRSGLFFVQVT